MSEIAWSFSSNSSGPRPNSSLRTSPVRLSALRERQRRILHLALEHRDDQPADFRLGVFALDESQPIEIEPIEQTLMHSALQLLIIRNGACRQRRMHVTKRSAPSTVLNA